MSEKTLEGASVVCGPDGYDGMTPKEIIMGLPRMLIPDHVINVLPQIRKGFDLEGLQELADSIPLRSVEGDTAHYDLLNPLTEGVHTEESARKYIDEYNMVNDANLRFEDFIPWDTLEGIRYVIHIAGERRKRSGNIRVEQDWGEPVPITWECAVAFDIPYMKAHPMQFFENNARRKVHPVNEAVAIRRHFDAMRRSDPKATKEACAKEFGVTADRVTDAEIFTDYPDSMQELVTSGKFKFRTIVEAKEVYELWIRHHDVMRADISSEKKLSEVMSWEEYLLYAAGSDGRGLFESIEELATYEVVTSLIEIKANALKLKQHPGEGIKRVTLKSIAEGLKVLLEQGMLIGGRASSDIMSAVVSLSGSDPAVEESPVHRRLIATQGSFTLAVEVIDMLQRVGAMSDPRVARLAKLGLYMTPGDIDGSPIDNDECSGEEGLF